VGKLVPIGNGKGGERSRRTDRREVSRGVLVAMFEGDWRSYLVNGFGALGFVAVLFWIGWGYVELRTQQTVSEYYTSQYETAGSNHKEKSPCSEVSEKELIDCLRNGIEAREERSREQRDLQAQEWMAFWAAWMTFASGMAAIATVFGLWLLRLTWKETKRTADVTREIGRDQTRAYVEVASVQFYWGTERGDSPRFRLLLDNYGETPAKWFQLRQAYGVFEHSDGSPSYTSFSELTLPTKFGQTWNGIRPRGEAMGTSGPPVVDLNEIKKCWRDPPNINGMPPDNTHGIMVFGEIRYCTIFNEIYVSQFLFGAGSLEAYEAEEIVERERIEKSGITYTHSTSFEKPKKLTRIAIGLDLFRPEQGSD